MALGFIAFFLPLIQPHSRAPPETEFFSLKKNQDSFSWRNTRDGCDGGTGKRGKWVWKGQEKEVPVGKVGVNHGLYFCGELLMACLPFRVMHL